MTAALALVIGLVVATQGASAASTFDPALTRAPYLTDLVDLHVTVNWATTAVSGAKGTLKWGPVSNGTCSLTNSTATAPSTGLGLQVGSIAERQWKASLTLPAQGSYCYRPMLNTTDLLAGTASPQFRSQVAAGDTTPFTFDVFGDWGQVDASGNNADQANLMGQIAASGARFAITAGDNGYNDGSQINYGDLQQVGANTSAIFGPNFWTKAGPTVPLFPTAGNHGLATANATAPHTDLTTWTQDYAVASSNGRYQNDTYCCVNGTTAGNYASGWYAFTAGNARFYVLDSAWSDPNVGTASAYANDAAAHFAPGTPEYQWLLNDLQTHPTALKFSVSHYPFYSDSASQSSDTSLQGLSNLEGLLGQYGVNIAFNGHAHIYERNTPSAPGMPITYVTGGGGATLGTVGPCSANDAYAIGWSASACGAAPKPTSASQVFHFLKVSVSGTSVTVTPTDSLGHTFDVQTYTFPSTPDTVIDSGPGASVNTSSAAFAFHSTRVGATFACSLDQAPATACTSPASYSNLAEGQHMFSVAATTSGGTDASPATSTWTIDTVPPSAPTGLTTSSPPTATSVALTWSGPADAVGYDVLRDGTLLGSAAPGSTSYLDTTVAPSSPYSYTVIAHDGAGNSSAPSAAKSVTTPAGSSGASLVQTAASSTTTVTLPGTSAPGDLLVLTAGVYTGATKLITAVNDGKNTWVKAGAYFASGQNSDGELWYAPNAAAVRSVTVTTTAPVALRVQEFRGVAPTNPLDAATGTTGNSKLSASGAATPSASGDLAVGFVSGHSNGQVITPTAAGFTSSGQQNTTSPNTVTLQTGYGTLSSAAAQTYSASTAGTMWWAAGIALFKTVQAPPPPNDFTVSAAPSTVAVTGGGAAGTSTISTALTTGSTSQPVTLSVSTTGLPSGLSATLDTSSVVSDQGTATLTVSSDTTVKGGNYSVVVTAAGATTTHSTTVTVAVTAAPPDDFTLTPSPDTLTYTAGTATSGSSTITAATTTGSNPQTVQLGISGAPTGLSAVLDTPSMTTALGTATLTVNNGTAAAGTYPITVTATGPSATHSTVVTVVVNAPHVDDFTLAASPGSVPLTVGGTGGTSSVSAALTTGSNPQQVMLAATGMPDGMTASFDNPIIPADGGGATLTLTAGSLTTPGSYPITVTGSGSISGSHTATVTAVVSAPVPDDFSVSATPTAVSFAAGSSGTSTVSTALTSGNAQNVSLSATGANLPAGLIFGFNPPSITSGGSSTLTVSTSSTVPAADYPITITAAGPSATHTTSVTVTVTAASTGTAPSFVQSANGSTSAAATSVTATFPSATTPGHLLVLSASLYTGATNHITSVTDSSGATWTRIGTYFASGHNSDGELWYRANAGSVTSVTIRTATAVSMAMSVQEFAGVATANALDTSVGASNTSTAPASGTVQPTAPNELAVGFLSGHASVQPLTVTTTGFTALPQANSTTPFATVTAAYQVLSATTAIGLAGSSATAMYWAAGVALFKSAG